MTSDAIRAAARALRACAVLLARGRALETPQDAARYLQTSPTNVRFSELLAVCERYLGPHRNSGSSHFVFPVPGDAEHPLLNIQTDKGGKAKPYQVKQVAKVLKRIGGAR